MQPTLEVVCDHCGEAIEIAIDLSQGSRQQYVEDCPVCCVPLLICVVIDEDGEAQADAERE